MYHRFLITIVLLGLFSTVGWSQPANNTCNTAIHITDISDYCSDYQAFTNVDATTSLSGGGCWSGTFGEVWFSFTALGTDVTVTVRGNDSQAPGGTLNRPEIRIFSSSDCSSFQTLACSSAPPNQHVISAIQGGLIPGETYYIAVQGFQDNQGTFQLCIRNYNPPAEPGQDCNTAATICDKSSFSVQQISGAGNVLNEAAGTCLAVGSSSESSSTWFSWEAATTGPLTFTLTPINEPDDLDFVVFELPNGDCASKIPLLCNAAGDSFYPSICMGPTGLNTSSTDTNEQGGCQSGQDGWLRPLDMEAGKTYAVLVNNYSNSGNGFTLDFGGSGEFVSPDVSFISNQPNFETCYGNDFVFTDASTFPGGQIALWEWSFGVDASIANANGQGPHAVSYSSTGPKIVTLRITTSEGCEVTYSQTVEVLPCCDSYNAIQIDPVTTPLDCHNDTDGIIDLTITSNANIQTTSWEHGPISEDINNLSPGTYTITVSNEASCTVTESFEIVAPPAIILDTIITKPTCNGGQDGAIEIPTTGGTSPYEYNFNNTGFGTSNVYSNIPIGSYDVQVRDANDCIESLLDIQVNELELVLQPNYQVIDTPSCFGYSDGAIAIVVQNGQQPYQYDFNDGNGFGMNHILDGISAGSYVVDVTDGNLCRGQFLFDIVDHPMLTMTIDYTDATCNGLLDGSAEAIVSGGVGGYEYRWDNFVNEALNDSIPAGTYSVTVLDANACEINDQVTIDQPMAIQITNEGVEGVICYGDTTGSLGITATGGIEPFLYQLNQGPFQQDTAFNNVPGGWNLLTAQDANGCIDTLSFHIPQPPELIVEAFNDTIVSLGFTTPLNSVVLPLGTEVTYLWFPNDSTLNHDTIPNPVVRPIGTGYYYLMVTDTNGCTALDSVHLNVILNKPVFAPTAFSPDGDGINDFFTLFGGAATTQINLLQVYDRWGGIVYQTKNAPISQEGTGWNGTYKGRKLGPGTYIWMAEVGFWDRKPVILKGEINLIR